METSFCGLSYGLIFAVVLVYLLMVVNFQSRLDPLIEAAWAAGVTRLRPVMMTALAMILGMLPMSLGMGEGGEQNAPLGRAAVGGLAMATFATLLFVPMQLAPPAESGTNS